MYSPQAALAGATGPRSCARQIRLRRVAAGQPSRSSRCTTRPTIDPDAQQRWPLQHRHDGTEGRAQKGGGAASVPRRQQPALGSRNATARCRPARSQISHCARPSRPLPPPSGRSSSVRPLRQWLRARACGHIRPLCAANQAAAQRLLLPQTSRKYGCRWWMTEAAPLSWPPCHLAARLLCGGRKLGGGVQCCRRRHVFRGHNVLGLG
ncbi:hypothetical protein SLA2020_338230 [Shorea laevis]